MKLAALALVTTLGLGGAAYADPARPDASDPDHPRGQLHQLLLERFDRNQDGRLEPRERRRAIRALRRLARRLAIQERRAEHQGLRQRGMVRRYDANGDGVVSPDEMPPGLARRLRPLDRNGDGWLDHRDQE
jgi:hypothetical protein